MMVSLFQKSGVANRWRWPDLTVTQQQRPQRFALSLPSAVRPKPPIKNRTLPPSGPSLGEHHTQAYPKTKSGADAVTFWQRFGFRIELSRGSRSRRNPRLLQGTAFTMGKTHRPATPARCLANKRRAYGMRLVLYTVLSKGGNSGATVCNPADWSGNQAPLDEPQRWIRGARAILR
jgi:hypothetical protein